ncbi:13523_t:CDS:2, partial [Dentiscutata heterogama]
LLFEALDSIEIESDSNIEFNSNISIDPCYDETLITFIISHRLNNLPQIINIHPKSDHWLGRKATIWDICSKFGIAEGTVPLFISRVIEALKLLKKDVIIWSCNNYQQRIHMGFEEMYSFPNVIGVLDESHMNLFEAPSKLNKDTKMPLCYTSSGCYRS